jgi:SAM-dependent methyltransferase
MQSPDTMTAAIRTAHNYHDWVFSSLERYIVPGTALEVGSGHGKYSRLIAPRVDRLIVSDIDPDAVEGIRAELSGVPNVDCMVMNGIEPGRLPPALDDVILINLLEHIEDDLGMLRSCADVLRPGGALILFVPAFQALYSRMDREAGHHRRYHKNELVALVRSAGFDVTASRYFNSVGFFGWLANKHLDSTINSPGTNAQVSLYDRMIPLIKHTDRALSFVGQSIVLAATRRP